MSAALDVALTIFVFGAIIGGAVLVTIILALASAAISMLKAHEQLAQARTESERRLHP